MLHHLIHQEGFEPFKVVFADSTITFPETLEYIQTIIKDFGIQKQFVCLKPVTTFYERLLKYNFWPSIRALWCRKILKLDLLKKYYNSFDCEVAEYIGVAQADSGHRRKRYTKFETARKWGRKLVLAKYPILKWTDEFKKCYFKEHCIPRNPVYETVGVSGCYFCPYYHEREFRRIKQVHPDLFQKLLDHEELTGKRALPDFWLKDI